MADRSDRSLERYPRQLEDGSQIVGMDAAGSIVYWDPVREVTLGGDVLPDGNLSEIALRRELGVDETIADVVGETVGRDELSEYAEGLPGTDDDDT
jgi:hypothetical protein